MKKKINFDILESLRGLAALYVCIAHCRGVLWIGGEHYLQLHPKETLGFSDYLLLGLNMLTRLSTEFVVVFFVLSGFSIAHSLRQGFRPLDFYKRRFIRLYPPYLMAIGWGMLVMFIIALVAPAFTDGTYHTPAFDKLYISRAFFSLTVMIKQFFYIYVPDSILNPFWSLTLEVIFYILAPFLFRNKNVFYAFSIIIFLVGRITNAVNIHFNHILEDYCFYNLFFAVGAFLYQHYESIVARIRFLSSAKSPLLTAVLFFAMIGTSLAVKEYHTYTALMAAMMTIGLIIYLLERNIHIKPMIAVGRFSYTLYITHFPTIYVYMTAFFLITGTAPYIFNPLVFLPCVLLCIGVAYGQYLLVEKRSKTVLDGLRHKKTPDIGRLYPTPG